jgi:hypothetical protein
VHCNFQIYIYIYTYYIDIYIYQYRVCRFTLIEDEKASFRLRILSAFVLSHVGIVNFPVIKEKYTFSFFLSLFPYSMIS